MIVKPRVREIVEERDPRACCICGTTKHRIIRGSKEPIYCVYCWPKEEKVKVPEKNAGGGVDGYGVSFDGKERPPVCPAKTHNAVCVDYIDMGEVEVDVYGKPGVKAMEHRAKFVYQLAAKMPDGRPYLLAYKPFGVKVSLHEKAAFRQHLESLYGRTLAVGEDVDPEGVVGTPCVIIVTHKASADGTKTYANIDSVGPHLDGLPVLAPTGYTRVKDRTNAHEPEPAEDSIPF